MSFSVTLVQKSATGGLKSYSAFLHFLCHFHSARHFGAYSGVFCGLFIYFGSVYIMWDEHGSHFSFCTFCVLQFSAFSGNLAVFAHFLGFIGNLGVLRAIISYKVTRGIPLIVGRVTKGFWGVWGRHRSFWGAFEGPGGAHSTPERHFLPLWRSCTAPDLVPNTT